MPAEHAYAQASLHEEMPVPPQILCFGHDSMLLYTRQRILGLLGCSVELIRSMAAFQACLGSSPPGLIILCQSLTAQERDDAIDLAADLWHGVPVLVMYTRSLPTTPSRPYTMLPTSAGPRAFGEAVLAMV